MTAFALSLVTMAMPLAFAAACSCAMLSGPEEAIASAELAFVGTTIEAAPAGDDDAAMGVGTIRYAFEVERASHAVDAVVEVRALDDPGGAACGFSFATGDRWLVMVHGQDGAMHTNLCSGNLLLTQMDEGELDAIERSLPFVPEPPAESSSAPGDASGFPVPVAVGGLAALALVGVMVLAFRGDRLR